MRIQQTIGAGRYNALLDVMEADAALDRLGRDAVLASLGAKILEYGLEDRVGLRLMHKHHALLEGEFMVERETTDEMGRPCLATVAEPRAESSAHPNSWAVTHDGLVPLEFSDDPVVAGQSNTLSDNPAFLGEFRATLETLSAGEIIGLCVLDRSFYHAKRPADGGHELVEHTEEAHRANVITFRDKRDLDKGALVQTVWKAFGVVDDREVMVTCDTDVSCEVRCLPYAIIHCEPNADGTHDRTTENSHKYPHEQTTIHTPVP